MATRMQQRRGTAAQWTSADPILAAAEIGFETDTGKFKIGNGSSVWSALSYFTDANSLIDGAPELLNTLNELAAAMGDDPDFLANIATNLSNHASDTTNIHGIADTADLVTLNDTQTLENKTLHSPTLSGSPIANNPDLHDNSNRVATTTYVQQELGYLINNAPSALNTLNELATALGEDPNFATTVTNSIATKVSKDGDTMTGALTLSGDPTENLHAATKQYVTSEIGSHSASTTNVHGIADTSDLVLSADLESHENDTTNVHGIEDTSALATMTYVENTVTTHKNVTTDVHGIPDTTVLATQADITNTENYADSAVTTHNSDTTTHYRDWETDRKSGV